MLLVARLVTQAAFQSDAHFWGINRWDLIRDTRPPEARKQTVGIRIEEQAGEVLLERNEIEAQTKIEDRRKASP